MSRFDQFLLHTLLLQIPWTICLVCCYAPWTEYLVIAGANHVTSYVAIVCLMGWLIGVAVLLLHKTGLVTHLKFLLNQIVQKFSEH